MERTEMLIRMHAASWLMFWLGCALAAVGFVANGMWNSIPWAATAVLAGLALASLLTAYAIGYIAKCAMATSAAITWLSLLVYFAGLSPSMAVVLIGFAAMAIGSLVVPADWAARAELSILSGLAILTGTIGWLLPFPVHFRAVYMAVLLLIIFARWRTVIQIIEPIPALWRASVEAAPATALLAVMVVGVIFTCAWIPTIHYDDLAFHVGMPRQLSSLGYYRMDVGSRIGGLSAWASDVVQGIAYILSNEEARGAVDVLWLTLTLTLIWKLCAALELSPMLRWLAVAIYASLPLTAGVLTGMQTEGPTAAVVAALALLIQRTKLPDRSQLMVIALLFGALLGLKVSNLMIAGALGLWLLWQWRFRLPWRFVPVALVSAIFVAGSSYFYSYILTGNPVLPFFNKLFQSNYFPPINFHDDTWSAGFNWDIIWRITFHTSDYLEGNDGAAGFVLIALAGSLLFALTNPNARLLVLAGIIGFLLPLTQIQYVRYAYPAFVLLIPAMLCGISVSKMEAWHRHSMVTAIVVLILCNLAFVSAGDWQLRQGLMWQLLTEGQSATIGRYAPTNILSKTIQARYGDSARTLIADTAIPYGAVFSGKAFVVNWYDQELGDLARKADADATGARWLDLIAYTGVDLLIVQKDRVSKGLDVAMGRNGATLIQEVSNFELWKLHLKRIEGVSVQAPKNAVIVKFNTDSAPSGPALVSAQIELKCKRQDVPIVITWKISEESGAEWRRSEWSSCRRNGLAFSTLDIAASHKVAELGLVASPSRPIDMGLELSVATVNIRKDLTAERDLAVQMRYDIRKELAAWIAPARPPGVNVAGTATLAPPNAVVVNFDVRAVQEGATHVVAELDLRCKLQDIPIVVGWKISEDRGQLPSYQWAICQQNGLAHATLDIVAPRGVTSFTATAIPSQPVDMGLGLSAASSNFSRDLTASPGIGRQLRVWLAAWISPAPEHAVPQAVQ